MEKMVRVHTTLSLDHIRVINPDGKYVACMVHLSAKDYVPYTYLNFCLLDADFAPECRDKFLTLMKFNGGFSEEFTDCIIGEVIGHTDVNGLITVNLDLKATPTDTVGKNQYVVCLACGGEMGAPQYTYRYFQIIGADSQEEAKAKYDEINHCTYFKGMCIGECDVIGSNHNFVPQRSFFDLVTDIEDPLAMEADASEINKVINDAAVREFIKEQDKRAYEYAYGRSSEPKISHEGDKSIADMVEEVTRKSSADVDGDAEVKVEVNITARRIDPPLTKEEMEDAERIAHSMWADPVGERVVNIVAKNLRKVPDDKLKRACETLGTVNESHSDEKPGFFAKIAIWFDRIFSH